MKVIVALLSMMRGSIKLVSSSIVFGWVTVMSWVSLIATSAFLLSSAALHPSIAELQMSIVGVRLFGLSRGVFRYLERIYSHRVTFKLLSDLRVWFYQQIEPIAPAGLQDYHSAYLWDRLLDDVEVLQEFYVRVFGPSIVAILSSLTIFWLFGQWSIQMGFVIIVFHIVVGVIFPLLNQRVSMQEAQKLVQNKTDLSVLTFDSIQGHADLVAFGQTSRIFQRVQDLLCFGEKSEKKMNLIQAASSGLVSTIINLSMIILLLISVPLVNSGGLDGKMLAVVILGSLASYEAVQPLSQAFQNLEKSISTGKKLFEFVDKPLIRNGSRVPDTEFRFPSIEVKKVKFAYRHKIVLSDIDLSLPYGKKLALVGLSGSGKTTITKLLLRFWDSYDGNILLNRVDIREFDSAKIRELIAYVPQAPYIFNSTISENIRIGNPSATMEDIEEAAKKATIHDFIISLPGGYQTQVGEMGVFLSGGQRQKLSIARAMIRDVPLYIFDEPFVHLDRIAEKQLYHSILQFSEGRSVFFITHQLFGLSEMDEIIVLRDGKILERGTEEELIRSKGEYLKMLEFQRDFILLND